MPFFVDGFPKIFRVRSVEHHFGVDDCAFREECQKQFRQEWEGQAQQKEKEISALLEKMTQKEKDQQDYDRLLLAREKDQQDWEEKLKLREAALTAWEKELQTRENEQQDREKKLLEWEQAADTKKKTLEEATSRYMRERTRWEEVRPVPSGDSAALGEKLISVRNAYVDTKDVLQELIRAVNNSDREGVTRLCALHRKMTFAGDPYAEELGILLQTEFGAVVIEPAPGDDFDPVSHERVRMNCPGETVSCCRVRGWRRKDEVLLRAVVETEERRK